MINKVQLIGNVGQDPEVRHTQGGTAVANFTLATNEKWKDKQSGEQKEKTQWHRIVVWDKLAEVAGKYVSKGKQLFVEGQLEYRKWVDKDGAERTTAEINCRTLKLLGRAPSAGASAPPPAPPASPPPEPASDDPLPF